MKKAAGEGENDKLRALTENPELRALMEQYEAAPPHESEAALKAFIEKADALYPDWREIEKVAENDGRIVRDLAKHCVLQIRACSDLDELERLEAKNAEADFVTCFDQIAKAPNASAAFRMSLAFYELMRIARLDPEEMKKIQQQAVSDHAREIGTNPKRPTSRAAHARKLFDKIRKEHPGFYDAEIIEEIENRCEREGVTCFTTRWLGELVRRWRKDNPDPPPPSARRRTYPLRRVRQF